MPDLTCYVPLFISLPLFDELPVIGVAWDSQSLMHSALALLTLLPRQRQPSVVTR